MLNDGPGDGRAAGPHRLRKLGLSPGPLRIIPLPRSNRQREGLEALRAVQRVLGGAKSLASDIEPLGPRQHPPPCDHVHLGVDGFCTCRWGTLRDDDDDFEAYSTAAIIDHLHEHQAAGHTFPLMPSTICRLLMPPRTMRGSSQGKDCGS
jgi:hypothetical protein